MLTPSLSPAAGRARCRTCRPGRLLGHLLALTLLAGCTVATAEQPLVGGNSSAPAVPSASVTPTPTPSVVLPTLPAEDKVLARVGKVSRTGIGASGIAVLSDTGTDVAARSADKPLAPASTLKVLTSLAALDLLGADHTFRTQVVSAGRGKLVLVGGGDPLLTDKQSKSAARPASLAGLAKVTAATLTAQGVKKVSLGYDAGLFTGPDFHRAWKKTWRDYLARVSPLVVDEGRFNPWQSHPKPALTAAEAFAARLRAAGIKVTGVKAAKAPQGATEVAAVESAPLETIVRRTLKVSDNLAAEVLARHVALATGAEPSFAGAAGAVRTWLVAHDLWSDGMKIVDGSGLSNRSRVTPAVLARAVVLSLNSPTLGAVAAGLPVAGRTGTLKDRFNDAAERAGRDNVHAKTGTLPGISALAGYLTTKDGARLVFAVIANGARGQTTAYNWLDRTAAALVRCGCN
jgi:D-alanyl-D-alanine carboxypeptidase/D-alanyl-D-alanine-endopeptidase (penicillin-binding protein 4)